MVNINFNFKSDVINNLGINNKDRSWKQRKE